MGSNSPRYVAANFRDVRSVDRDIFVVPFVSDCGLHTCLCRDEGDQVKLDACCQHGADVRIPEKAAILKRSKEVASVLPSELRDPAGWFDERDPESDPDAPGGYVVRTATSDLEDDSSGCIFLQHEGDRGCGLHVAALTHGFDPAEIKPTACRMYPLYLVEGTLGFSDDFDRYSCAGAGTLSVYRVMRPTLADLFGPDLVDGLDQLEAELTVRRLAVVK